MTFVCFPGRALSKDLINFPTLARPNRVLGSGPGTNIPALCLTIEKSRIGFLRAGGTASNLVANCANL